MNICRCCGGGQRYACGYCRRFCHRRDGSWRPSRRQLPHNPHKRKGCQLARQSGEDGGVARPAVPALDVDPYRLAQAMHDHWEGVGTPDQACGSYPDCPSADAWLENAKGTAERYAALRSKEPTPSQDTARRDSR